MATTKAPLFGLDASGSLGGSIVFSKWRGRTYVRRLSIPANPRSGLQVGMRSSMKFITQDFTNLTTAQKAAWDTLAAVTNITQLNAQVQDAQRRTRRNLGVRRGPAETAGTTPNAPTIDTVTAQPKTLVLDWSAGAAAPEYAWMIFKSPTGTFTPDVSNLIAIVAAATLTLTVPNLVTGVEQFFEMKGLNFDGELGANSAENSGTPT